MRDRKLRKFLGVIDYNGFLSAPISINGEHLGMLVYLRDRIESLEKYLGVEYKSFPSSKGYPKYIKKIKK